MMAVNATWRTAALLSDEKRRVIRERLQAGESVRSIAEDFKVPEAFVAYLGQWHVGRDEKPESR